MIEAVLHALAERGQWVGSVEGAPELFRIELRHAARRADIRLRTGIDARGRVWATTPDGLPANEPWRGAAAYAQGLRAATVAAYCRYIRVDIVPGIGGIKLRALRRHHVDTFLQKLLRDGRGVVKVHRIHAVISSALALAYRLDLVPLNAASGVTLPRERSEKLRVWEPDQVRTFLAIASMHRLGPVYDLVVRTGLRRGEVAGLRWEDVDLDARRLVVRQQRVQVDTVVVTNHAKTDHGQDRRVTLDEHSVELLRAQSAQQTADRHFFGSGYQPSGFVFTYEDGRPLNPYTSQTSSDGS